MELDIGRQIFGGDFGTNTSMYGAISTKYKLSLLMRSDSSSDDEVVYFKNVNFEKFKIFVSMSDYNSVTACKNILKSMIRQVMFTDCEFVKFIIVKWKILSNSVKDLNNIISSYVEEKLQGYSNEDALVFTYNIIQEILTDAKKKQVEITYR